MGRKSSIARLSPEIKGYIEAMLATGGQTLDELIADLRERFPVESSTGDLPSRSAIGRYGQKLERRLSAIRASTEAAKIIQAQVGDREDARSGALLAMIQAEIFDSIVLLKEADDEEVDAVERLNVLSAASKNIATLTRSSISLKKYQAEIETAARAALLAEQEANLQQAVRAQGMSEEQADFMRRQILGMA